MESPKNWVGAAATLIVTFLVFLFLFVCVLRIMMRLRDSVSTSSTCRPYRRGCEANMGMNMESQALPPQAFDLPPSYDDLFPQDPNKLAV
jgi:hypothetical protein